MNNDNAKNYIELPAEEFEVIEKSDDRLVLYDIVVDKVYTWTASDRKWSFPRGARVDIINILTGVEL